MENSLPSSVLIIIPCFNEKNRFDVTRYSDSLHSNKHAYLLFVDDGSTDRTREKLDLLKSMFSTQVDILSLEVNKGKAEAIRAGVHHSMKNNQHFDYICYIDADLATSVDEILSIADYLSLNEHIKMAFGSRILMVGTNISRNRYRHYIGRIIATLIANLLRLQVYDTQCGAKVFSKELAQFVFKDCFISKWLFDVEIFARVLCEKERYGQEVMKEIPLNAWIDKGESKVSSFYIFKMFYDLFKINRSYPKLYKRTKLF